jgi:hypothetical protein
MGEQSDRIRTPGIQSPALRSAGRVVLDLILPLTGFDGGEAQSPWLSSEAWRKITFIADPTCDGCGLPFNMIRCAMRWVPDPSPAFARARAACRYDEHSRDLILQLKHADKPELGGLFARWLTRAAAPLIEGCDAIAPVPMHRTRLFRRRYNQAAEIARPLANLSGLAYLPDALVRARYG